MRAFFETRNESLTTEITENTIFPLHLHPQVEFYYVLSGEACMTVRGETKILMPGSLAVVFPNQTHSYAACAQKNHAVLIVCDLSLTAGYADTLLQMHPENPFLLPGDLHPNVEFAVRELAVERKSGNSTAVSSALVQLILARVLPRLSLRHNRASDYEELTYQIALYIAEHYQENLTLASLSRELGVSKFHLSHVFSEKIGQHFSTYLSSIRVDHACALLANTNRSVTDIAAESGFESQRSFFRAFKASCGVTPLAYRRNVRGMLSDKQ